MNTTLKPFEIIACARSLAFSAEKHFQPGSAAYRQEIHAVHAVEGKPSQRAQLVRYTVENGAIVYTVVVTLTLGTQLGPIQEGVEVPLIGAADVEQALALVEKATGDFERIVQQQLVMIEAQRQVQSQIHQAGKIITP